MLLTEHKLTEPLKAIVCRWWLLCIFLFALCFVLVRITKLMFFLWVRICVVHCLPNASWFWSSACLKVIQDSRLFFSVPLYCNQNIIVLCCVSLNSFWDLWGFIWRLGIVDDYGIYCGILDLELDWFSTDTCLSDLYPCHVLLTLRWQVFTLCWSWTVGNCGGRGWASR